MKRQQKTPPPIKVRWIPIYDGPNADATEDLADWFRQLLADKKRS